MSIFLNVFYDDFNIQASQKAIPRQEIINKRQSEISSLICKIRKSSVKYEKLSVKA